MLGNLPLDIITGGGSFLLSSVMSFIGKGISLSGSKNASMMNVIQSISGGPKTEEDKKRDHEVYLKNMDFKNTQEKRAFDDVKSARGMTSRFVGITRRGLAWTIPFIIIALFVVALISIYKDVPAVSIPITEQHSVLFGLVSWTTHTIQELHGLYIPAWFQTWVFMIGGFYFGREAAK